MLKITTTNNEGQRTLTLEGQLIDPWVSELAKSWSEAQRMVEQGRVCVDLKDVTAISPHGENLLFQMMCEGATFSCCRGVLTRHVVSELERRRVEQARNDRRR